MGKKVNYFDFRFRKSLRYEKRHTRDSLVAQMVKSLPTVWETQLKSLGSEDPLEKEMATHSSILAWKNPKDENNPEIPPSSRDEGLRLLHGLETNLATSLQTPQEA